jgi:hypothetical protein
LLNENGCGKREKNFGAVAVVIKFYMNNENKLQGT